MIGYIDITDEMHYEFDMTFDTELGTINADVFSCGVGFTLNPISGMSSLHAVDLTFYIPGLGSVSCQDLGTDAVSLCNWPPPAIGETYHFEVDYTQSWVNIRFGDHIIYSKPKSGHATDSLTPCYVAGESLYFLDTPVMVPAEQVTLSDFMVSTQETIDMSFVEFPTTSLVVAAWALAGDETADTNTPLKSQVVDSEEGIDLLSMAMGIAIGVGFSAVTALLVVLVMRRRERKRSTVTSTSRESGSTTASLDMTEVNA